MGRILNRDTPAEVIYLYLAAERGYPVGRTFYDMVVNKYPKYFKEQIEQRKIWDSIPNEEKQAYWDEYFERLPLRSGPGLRALIENPDLVNEIPRRKEEDVLKVRKELHEKYFSKYGLIFRK